MTERDQIRAQRAQRARQRRAARSESNPEPVATVPEGPSWDEQPPESLQSPADAQLRATPAPKDTVPDTVAGEEDGPSSEPTSGADPSDAVTGVFPAAPAAPAARHSTWRLQRRSRSRVSLGTRLRSVGRLPYLVALAVVIAVVAASVVVYATPVLDLRRVEVSGTGSQLSATAVRSAAAVRTGAPLSRVDTSAVMARVQAVPAVASATVSRSWPHSLLIDVTPRAATAAVRSGDVYRRIDAHGVVFGKPLSKPGALLPVVLSHPGPTDAATTALLSVLGSLPARLRSEVAYGGATSGEAVTLRLHNGMQVFWGDSGNNATKSGVVLALLRRQSRAAAGKDVSGSSEGQDQAPVTRIDVSAPNLVTTR